MKDMMIRLCLLVTLVGTTVAQESPIKNFKIVAINGRKDVKVLNSENTLAPKPSVNQELNFGTTIKTGRRTTVDLSFSEGNTFRILARTKIKITENAKDPRLKVLHVSAGSVEMKLDKYPEGHKLQVETPTAVCGVVGTRFIVSFEDDPAKEDADPKLASSRRNKISCSEGQVFAASRFDMGGEKPAIGKTLNVPSIKAGTEVVVTLHEGEQNSYTDIQINRGSLALDYGVKGGAQVLVKPESAEKPARFVCAIEKTDSTSADVAIMEVKSGEIEVKTFKPGTADIEETESLDSNEGVVMIHNSEIKSASSVKNASAYMDAAREEGELHSQLVDAEKAGTATDEMRERVVAAANKATKLRKSLLTKSIQRQLRSIRSGSRRKRIR